jgi:hypothetical protein
MKTLREGYARLDAIIRKDGHLSQAVENFLEECIDKYNLCVTDMQEYKRLWTKEILPRQEEQSQAWKCSSFKPAILNPYWPDHSESQSRRSEGPCLHVFAVTT